MSAHAFVAPLRLGLSDVLRTARLLKIAPVPLLAWSGYALVHRGDAAALAWVTLGVVAVSVLVTRLNVLTDEALDRSTRPELALSLRRSASWVTASSAIEIGLFVLALAHVDAVTRVALLSLAVTGVLYSYNFFARAPVAGRWKTHWLGHALAFVGSYAALWVAGAGRGGLVLLVALATGIADYAVYVGECAIDHEEEARAGLRTSAALLGPRTSSLVAVVLLAVGALLHLPFVSLSLAPVFVPPLVMRGAMLVALAWSELASRPDVARRLRLRAADAVFLGARVWTFVALVVLGAPQ